MYEESITQHGLPASVVYDDDRGTWLEARPIVDYALAAREQWQKENPNPEPGTVLTVVDTWPGDQPADDDQVIEPSTHSQ